MQGDYVLVCKGDKWLIPLACNQVIISFSWRTNLQMFIGSIKHDVTITKIKLSCVSFAPHSRIFLVGGSSISTASTTVRNWTASLKFQGWFPCERGNDACREFEHGSKVPLQPRKVYVIDLFLLFYFHLFFFCFLPIFHSVHAQS